MHPPEILNISVVGAVSTGDGLGHRWGRNGEFCVVVCPAIRTVGILANALAVNLNRLSGFR